MQKIFNMKASNLSVSKGYLRYAAFAQRLTNNVRLCRKVIEHYFDWMHVFFPPFCSHDPVFQIYVKFDTFILHTSSSRTNADF